MTADNATSNDVQVTELASGSNAFQPEQHVRCFNHTMNLVVKSILKPFSVEKKDSSDDTGADGNSDSDTEGDDDIDGADLEDSDDEADTPDGEIDDEDEDEEIDPYQGLSDAAKANMLAQTTDVRNTLSKVNIVITVLP